MGNLHNKSIVTKKYDLYKCRFINKNQGFQSKLKINKGNKILVELVEEETDICYLIKSVITVYGLSCKINLFSKNLKYLDILRYKLINKKK